jgi:hypothetical protein
MEISITTSTSKGKPPRFLPISRCRGEDPAEALRELGEATEKQSTTDLIAVNKASHADTSNAGNVASVKSAATHTIQPVMAMQFKAI